MLTKHPQKCKKCSSYDCCTERIRVVLEKLDDIVQQFLVVDGMNHKISKGAKRTLKSYMNRLVDPQKNSRSNNGNR